MSPEGVLQTRRGRPPYCGLWTTRSCSASCAWSVTSAVRIGSSPVCATSSATSVLCCPSLSMPTRVFHPAGRRRDTDAAAEEVSWSQVAAANGRVAHASMEWIAITGDWRYPDRESQPGVWSRRPSRGSLPANQIAILARVLERFTKTPSTCWFAVWDGSGTPVYPRPVHTVPMPNRPMALFAGPLGAVTTSFGGQPFECAHLWWPEDRSWCVASDVDLMSTYVAGSVECVAAVLADEDLESFPVTVDQSVTWDSDTVNPTPSGSAEIGGTPISRRHSRRLQRTPRTTSSSHP
jgi:hypothetical protein